jgi:ribose transport system substrate-binding protein
MEAIRILRGTLNGIPLIGFCGAPFTVASYIIEGGSSREFLKTKSMMYSAPEVFHALMDKLSDVLRDYLVAQIHAGAQAVQVFDSWVGALSPQDYENFVLPYSRKVLQAADADSQAQQIEQAISKKPDVLVVLPQDGAALTPVAQKAERAGIRVVNVDRLFTAPDAATSTILGDNYQIGVLAANYIADERKCEGNVVEIQGLAGISVTTDRTKGFTDTLKQKCPDGGVKIVASQPGDFNPDKGLTVMENILQAQSDIDAVYTHDDDMAQGVVQAIRNAGRDDEMFLTGVGGSQDAMQQIKEGGLYRATFLYNPNMAASAVNMARLIGLDEGFSDLVPPEVPRQVVVPAAVVTKDNVDEYEQYAFD